MSIFSMIDAWSLFCILAERKGFIYRPLDSYVEMVNLAQPHQCLKIFLAYLNEKPVEAIVVVRDRMSSYYISGALDVVALSNKQESPACLLQWEAMRFFFRQGVKYHNLGTRSGKVYQFKRKFRPTERVNPPPLTLVTNRFLYSLWSVIVLRFSLPLWPRIKGIISG